MDIGHRMKELRIQYGLTQQELADRAELTKGFISQLERNQNSPSVGTLLDIIQCLVFLQNSFFLGVLHILTSFPRCAIPHAL